MTTATLLDRILECHTNSVAFATDSMPKFKDNEINVPLLGKEVQEDDKAWFIEHNGTYLLYCAKRSNSNPETDGIENLKGLLAEMWGRYTERKLQPQINWGYKV